MKLPQMQDRIVYPIMCGLFTLGLMIMILSGGLTEVFNHSIKVNLSMFEISAFIMLLSPGIFFYHFYTILNEKTVYNNRGKVL